MGRLIRPGHSFAGRGVSSFYDGGPGSRVVRVGRPESQYTSHLHFFHQAGLAGSRTPRLGFIFH